MSLKSKDWRSRRDKPPAFFFLLAYNTSEEHYMLTNTCTPAQAQATGSYEKDDKWKDNEWSR